MSFEGRVAVIVGGCNGIGREVAIDLASAGADIAVADIDDASMKSVENDVRLLSRKCLTVSTDATNWNEVVALRDKVLERFEKVDILVNTVGGATVLTRGESRSICNPLVSTENLDLEKWNRTIDVNLKGPFLCAKIFIPIMNRRKHGKFRKPLKLIKGDRAPPLLKWGWKSIKWRGISWSNVPIHYN